MKTLVIRLGEKHTIRAIAFPAAEPHARDSCPTLKFFEEQSKRDAEECAHLAALLTQTARSGPPQNPTRFKPLSGTDGLYEFKTPGGLRLFCFWDDDSLIICTHGMLKKQQKTPKHEIKRAGQLKSAYLDAKKKGKLEHAKPKPPR